MRWLKNYARSARTRKMNGLGFRDWPDRLVLKPGVRRPLWLEFKKPGEELTRSQGELHRHFERIRQTAVYVVHSDGEARQRYLDHCDRYVGL